MRHPIPAWLPKAAVTAVLAAAFSVAPASAETAAAMTLTAAPMAVFPLSSGDFGSNEDFDRAFGGSASFEYAPQTSLPLLLRLSGAYTAGGLKPAEGVAIEGTLSELSLLAGVGAYRSLFSALSLQGFLDGGAALGRLDDGDGAAYASLRAGAALKLRITEGISARLEGAWTYMFGLYGGISATLGLSYALPTGRNGADPRRLEFVPIRMDNLFPMFRSYYDDNALGLLRVTNTGKSEVTGVRISFIIRQYMDAPKECAVLERLGPGESAEVPLYGLFNDRILSVTEATKVGAEVMVEHGSAEVQTKSFTVLVYDRNALTWDDDRHAAAFVSSKDPWVLDLSGNIVAAVKDERNPEVPANIQTAAAFHEGLRAYGLSYVVSPNRPFAAGAADAAAVDSLKFPRQTLGYRAGDCADLSVLYASFLEAAGIRTAFVTVPGHIFLAFDSGLTPKEAAERAMDERELIVADEKVWIPLETTMRSSGFLEAWRKAAAQWREAGARGVAGFHPVREAWETFPPVGLPADGSAVSPPAAAAVGSAFSAELAKIVSLELNARLARLGPQPASAAGRFLNERGILYAKYGRYDEAERDLRAAAKDKYLPAAINLGNMAYLRRDYAAAYERFAEASRLSPDNPRLLVSMAKAASALGRGGDAASLLEKVRALDPKTAERYAMLADASASAGRASRTDNEEILWF